MKKIIISMILLLAVSQVAFAQNRKVDTLKKKIKSEKVAYLTSEMNLTPQEAEKFWPIYNEYEVKKMKINMDLRRNTFNINANNEALAQKAVLEYVATYKQEADLMQDYAQKFLQILPAQKVLALFKAEKSFKRNMIHRFKKGNYSRKNKTQRQRR